MKHQKTSLVVAVTRLLALGSLLSPCHAEILAKYEFTGASATQTSGDASGTNVTFGTFTGGGAAGTIGFSGSTNSIYVRWNATGATATDGDTLAEAITLGNYATFTLTNSTGQTVDLTNLTFDIFFEPYTTGVETSVFVMSDSSGFTDGDQLGGVTYASGTAPGLADTPDTVLTPQWSTDLEFWEDFTSPQSETPNGDGLVNWIFVVEGPPEHLFIRLQATPETTE